MTNRSALQAAMPKTITFKIAEGQEVRIRELTGAGRVDYLKRFRAVTEAAGLQESQVVAIALVEEDGSQSFDPDKPEDLAFLGSLSGAVLSQIADEFHRLSGLGQKPVEEARGN